MFSLPYRFLSRRTIVAGLALALLGTTATGAEPVGFESLLREMVNREALARWPEPGHKMLQASSWDRASRAGDAPSGDQSDGGWYANRDHGQFLRDEERNGRTEHVMMEHDGPGALVRIWSANPDLGGTLRVYLDGGEAPVLEHNFRELTGGNGPVASPLSAVRARGHNLYLPIPFAKSCKVTIDANGGNGVYYIVNYRAYEPGAQVTSFAAGDLERHAPTLKDVQARLAKPTSERPISATQQALTIAPGRREGVSLGDGPGAVRELGVTVDAGADADATAALLRSLVLVIDADGERTVEVPLGDFFGSGVGVNAYEDWYRTVTKDGAMTCRWVMPFEKGMEVRIENRGEREATLRLSVHVSPWRWDERSMHFRANFRQERDIATRPRQDWNYLTVAGGRGVYVGDTLAVANPTPAWWGEGDEKVFVDGEAFPSHIGTGTEDYYGYAWCCPDPFAAPFHAQPRADGPDNYGHVTNTRTRSLDAIPFESSFVFDMEVWHWQDVKVSYAATAYWYGQPGARATGPSSEKADLAIPALPAMERFPGAIEGESMEVVAKSDDFPATRQGMMGYDGAWSYGSQLWARPRAVGGWIDLKLATPDRRPQQLTLHLTKARDYGIVQVSVNGQPVGQPIDLWSQNVAPSGAVAVGTFTPAGETTTVRLEVVGTNPKAAKPGTMIGLDAITLAPADDVPRK